MDNHVIYLKTESVNENLFSCYHYKYYFIIIRNYIKIVSQFSYSGEELSGVGGLKMSFDFRNFDCRSIFTPVELETSSSDALSRDDLGADFARVFLNLSCSLPPCFVFEDDFCLGEEARIGLSSYKLGFCKTK